MPLVWAIPFAGTFYDSGYHIAAALLDTAYSDLARGTTASVQFLGSVLVCFLAAYVGFIVLITRFTACH